MVVLEEVLNIFLSIEVCVSYCGISYNLIVSPLLQRGRSYLQQFHYFLIGVVCLSAVRQNCSDSNHLSFHIWKSPVCVTPEAQVPLTLESKFRMTPIKS